MGQAFAELRIRIEEIREYVSYFLAVKADELKLVVRNTVVYAVLGIVGLLAAAAAVVTAVVMLLTGAAHGLGTAMGNMWLGDLVVGAGLLIVVGLGAVLALSSVTRSSRKNMVEKYENRKRPSNPVSDPTSSSAPGAAEQ